MKHYLARIDKASFEDNKSTLQITVDENILEELQRYKTTVIEIAIADNRTITPEQRGKIYATLRDISNYLGDLVSDLKEIFKCILIERTGCNWFSLSDCSVTTAREYINILLEFCLEVGIPLSDLALNRTDDINNYLYYCIKTRTCCITGKKNADIHHVEGSRVGMGGNRNKIDNRDRELIALSREWHNKVHAEGEEEIFNLYHIYGIKVDEETLKDLGLSIKDIS